MIIELHLLQSFPVSNLNRDDVGQPKTATFGGQVRGRISSQSLKRAARLLFNRYGLRPDETGVRTKRLVEQAAGLLKDEHQRDFEEAVAVASSGLLALGFGLDKRRKTLSEYLLFVGTEAATLLAEYCERDWDRLAADAVGRAKAAEKKKADATEEKTSKVKPDKATLDAAARILDASRVVDIALFGRMIADNKDFNVSAASQVAHAISTHAVVNEYDYYTAVDDLQPQDESGADMIGTVDFNSACYYRYANLHLDQLASNLSGDTELVGRATRAWLEAFIDAVPSGKQNSTAALTPPETLLVVVRDRSAWNLANAFLKPVTGNDLMVTSTQQLFGHFNRLRRFYGEDDLRAVVAASITADVAGLDEREVAPSRYELVARVLAATKG
ncbi:type I-E CRISPR-associated protein Cas7/Cse4/CasC [Micromonospora craniellae]|uniref:Type I-E CRISPR-associated protein Cas7/Cse4/CasC n=1 Tax=Micromonospora craniellae TaxID=2294034 RepID=A0A372FRL2_9ACTN|nr:type I-E CRISPR-associated protein Cas7/Cse4/CasC [Micromonospora craniellae]QOC92370.1 type I-E CRISPR-associated protein Cas7/Cse4/CasC [Micromonospora craniellae]RFS43373.1 type I-E CRISPR-associated protein Cas7/Cse4/CasC [Micromonospora craniellae]